MSKNNNTKSFRKPTTKEINNALLIVKNKSQYSKNIVDDAKALIYEGLYHYTTKYMKNRYFKNDIDVAEEAHSKIVSSLFETIEKGNYHSNNGLFAYVKKACMSYAKKAYDKKIISLDEEIENDNQNFSVSEDLMMHSLEMENQARSVEKDPMALHNSNSNLEVASCILKKAITNSRHHQIYVMHHLNDMTSKEISEVLNMSENTVKSAIKYCRKALQKFIETNNLTIDNVIEKL